MRYYIIRLEWSQTDHETVIVQASSKENALKRLDKCNARYKVIYSETGKLLYAN